MTKKSDKKKGGMISVSQTVTDNRKAFFDYEIMDTFEAGIQLTGTEVKSLRMGQCSLKESYVGEHQGDICLINAHIPEYPQAGPKMNHDPKRIRKLLLHKREIDKLLGAVQKQGLTIAALKIYFNKYGLGKLEIGLARGKKEHDKRETVKKRDWSREKQRLLRDKG